MLRADTAELRALLLAEQNDEPCPKCGQDAFQSDCWQIAALDWVGPMMDEIDELRAALADLVAVHDHDPGQHWASLDRHEAWAKSAWGKARALIATDPANKDTPS